MGPTELFPRPEDWETTTVGESIEIKRGISWSKDQEHESGAPGRVPVIRVGNVQGRLDLTDLMYLSGIDLETKAANRADKGWTILVGSNGNRARIGNAILYRDEAELLFASFLVGTKPSIRSGVDPEYFYRWLSSEQVQALLSASAEGTTGLNNLSHSFFKRMTIPVPSIDEQAAIARILDGVDSAIESAHENVKRAQILEQTVLEEAFSNLASEPSLLGDFCADVRYGTSKASNDNSRGNAVLRIPNVIGDRLFLDDLAYVDLPETEVERLRLYDGDLLLVRTNGNPNYVGRSVVFRQPDTQTWVYASYLIRVRMRSTLLPDYVNVFLGLERGRRELLRRVTTSAGNHNINSNSIRLIQLPVPVSPEAQTQVVELAKGCRSLVDSLKEKTKALENLKRCLMNDLLTGRVRVNEVLELPVQ